ncbi:MAG: hypothetical protein WKG32_01275 [Gemmatimonadaceae bacterium]
MIFRPSRGPAGRSAASASVRLGLSLIGLATFGYGIRVEDGRVRWLGIAFLAAEFVVRFLRRRSTPEDGGEDSPPG